MRKLFLSVAMCAVVVFSCAHATTSGVSTASFSAMSQGILAGSSEKRFIALLKNQPAVCGAGSLLECGEGPQGNRCANRCRGTGHYAMRLLSDGSTDEEIAQSLTRRYRGPKQPFDQKDGPKKGQDTAQITIVVFSDFQCPHCRIAAGILDEVYTRYPESTRIVYKYAALSSHLRAEPAAHAAQAAHLQGKFWAFHDVLFQNQELLEDQDLVRYAEKANLDIDRFNLDRASIQVAKRVKEDTELMDQLHILATPTLYIDGVKFTDPIRTLNEYIKEEIGF